MTDYKKWDKIVSSIGDSDEEDEDHDAINLVAQNSFSDIQHSSGTFSLSESSDAVGFAELKQHCVKLLGAKTNAERYWPRHPVMNSDFFLFSLVRKMHASQQITCGRNSCLQAVSGVFEQLGADQAKKFSQFVLLPVLLLLREAAKSLSISARCAPRDLPVAAVSDRTVELALLVVHTVAQRTSDCESLPPLYFCVVHFHVYP